jgi:phage terminase small subunit
MTLRLNTRQARFVEEYLRLQNAAEAARRAGYSQKGAAVMGSRLLRLPRVAEALRAAGIEPPQAPPAPAAAHRRDGLTQRQRLFVENFLQLGNATLAADRAGYSHASAQAIGSELLHYPKVAAAIARANDYRSARTGVTAERVLREQARIAFFDIGAVASWGPDGLRVKSSEALEAEDRIMVAEIIERAGPKGKVLLRIRLHNKQRALESLMRHLRLYDPDAATMVLDMSEAAKASRNRLRDRLLQIARGEE